MKLSFLSSRSILASFTLMLLVGCASHPKDPNAPITSLARITSDPVAAVKAVLPQGWRISRVEENTYPFYMRAGKGTAIRLVNDNHRGEKAGFDATVYIMPADYDDGGKDFTRGETQTTPPTLLATAENGKIYLWGTADEWPTIREDIRKALVGGK